MPGKPHSATAQIVWLDPGSTTGVAVLSLAPSWLAGEGDADWAGLRKAVKSSWYVQIGDESREWIGGHGEPVHRDDFVPERIYSGPPLSPAAANELSMIFAIRNILDLWPGACWGYEDYVPESMAAAQKGALSPMRVFSTLAFSTIMDDRRPRVPFVQSRSMKYTANDERMRSAGLYLPGMPHATDAARHAAIFARTARQKSSVRKIAWPRIFDPERKRT